jgi:Fe-S-cluster containining protein
MATGMPPSPILVSLRSGILELDDCRDGATLGDLEEAVSRACALTDGGLGACARCGRCCAQDIPVMGVDLEPLLDAFGEPTADGLLRRLIPPDPRPDPAARRKAIRGLARDMGIPEADAELLHDYNNGDPVIMGKAADGACGRLRGKLCSIHAGRPLACRLFHCRLGGRLSVLHEGIVRHGAWHLYARLGWIGEGELHRNPFIGAGDWRGIPLSAFEPADVRLSEAARDCL